MKKFIIPMLKKEIFKIGCREFDYYYLDICHIFDDRKDHNSYGLIAGKISNYSGGRHVEKLRYWERLLNQGKWKEACDKTASFFCDKQIDAFILVPSKNKEIYSILREAFKTKLKNAKDLSDLLEKNNVNFRELKSKEIMNHLKLNGKCSDKYSNLLIVDDYFSRGETFKGVYGKIFDNNAICAKNVFFVTPGRSHETFNSNKIKKILNFKKNT